MTDPIVRKNEELSDTSVSLLNRVKQKDAAAWKRLVEVYSPLVYWWCRRAQLQPADAADVGQNVFISISRKIADFRRDRAGDSFRNWIYRITTNKINDFHRKNGRQVLPEGGSDAHQRLAEHEDPASSETASYGETVSEQRLLVRSALEAVRNEFELVTWQAFWNVTVEEMSPQDVAAKLGITVNAVYLAKSRVKRRLVQEFAELMDFSTPAERLP